MGGGATVGVDCFSIAHQYAILLYHFCSSVRLSVRRNRYSPPLDYLTANWVLEGVSILSILQLVDSVFQPAEQPTGSSAAVQIAEFGQPTVTVAQRTLRNAAGKQL